MTRDGPIHSLTAALPVCEHITAKLSVVQASAANDLPKAFYLGPGELGTRHIHIGRRPPSPVSFSSMDELPEAKLTLKSL